MNPLGLKHRARKLAEENKIPLLPGTDLLESINEAVEAAIRIGYPIMLKSTAGGGGIGMQLCWNQQELEKSFDSVQRLSKNNFSNSGLFIEKFVEHARHIEVQVFGDGKGKAIAIGERDCSTQRRNQKVIEETPAPNITPEVRAGLHQTATRLVKAVNYRNAGTVEFVYDQSSDQFYFLEVNTRLQVEHGITEQVFNIDLVEWMIKLAAYELPDLDQLETALTLSGHAIQARIYAEDPNKDFQPCAGLLSEVSFPVKEYLRIDHWLETGIEVSPYLTPCWQKLLLLQKIDQVLFSNWILH